MVTLILTMPGFASAQTCPARPVTVVIMYAAGGGTDVLIRKLADEMARARGCPARDPGRLCRGCQLGLPDPDGFDAWWPAPGYRPLDL